MKTKLPKINEAYIEAKNAHDIKATTLACFSENAVVHDEGKDLHVKPKIKEWLEETIRKYKGSSQAHPIHREKWGVRANGGGFRDF